MREHSTGFHPGVVEGAGTHAASRDAVPPHATSPLPAPLPGPVGTASWAPGRESEPKPLRHHPVPGEAGHGESRHGEAEHGQSQHAEPEHAESRHTDAEHTESSHPESGHAGLRDRLAALIRPHVVDDGSFASRLAGQPRLVDALLGRSLLCLDVLGPDAPGQEANTLGALIADVLDVRGQVSVHDASATLDALEAVHAVRNAIEALEGLLLERARRQFVRAEAVLDDADPMVRAAHGPRRRELAARAAVADAATALHLTEHQAQQRMMQAQALAARAPRTLAGAVAGTVPWANAGRVADAVGELDEATAARLDQATATAAACQNSRRFAQTVRREARHLCPIPAEVAHAEAATKRAAWSSPARDGMAYLTLFAPAPAVHAIADRLDTVARTVRGDGDGRTLDQLRTDIACALLLDDGTLDLTAVAGPTDTSAAQPAATHVSRPTTGPADGAAPEAPQSTASAAPFAARPAPFERTAFSLAAMARSVRPRIYVTVPVLTLLGRADAPGMLDGTVPIDADTARELAGLATSFTRLLTHPETGRILSVGSEAYRPPADLRHFVTVRDTTCRFPGCCRPAARADADHTVAHADGGPTAAGNLAALCRRHHVLKHQACFTVRQTGDDGTLEWTTPTGRVHRTRPDLVPATIHRATDGEPDLEPAPAPAVMPQIGPEDDPESPPF